MVQVCPCTKIYQYEYSLLLPGFRVIKAQAFHWELDVSQRDGQGVLEVAGDGQRLVDFARARHLLEWRKDGGDRLKMRDQSSSKKGNSWSSLEAQSVSRSVLTWGAQVGHPTCLCHSLRFHVFAHACLSSFARHIFQGFKVCNLTVARSPRVNYILIASIESGLPFSKAWAINSC